MKEKETFKIFKFELNGLLKLVREFAFKTMLNEVNNFIE